MRHPQASLTFLATLCAALIFGCSSQPDRPSILVSTTPPGASCTLSRLGQPIATAEPTPAIALVEPNESEIAILCRRPGFEDAAATLVPHKAELSFGQLLGAPFYEYEHRVDIALKAKSSSAAPLTGH